MSFLNTLTGWLRQSSEPSDRSGAATRRSEHEAWLFRTEAIIYNLAQLRTEWPIIEPSLKTYFEVYKMEFEHKGEKKPFMQVLSLLTDIMATFMLLANLKRSATHIDPTITLSAEERLSDPVGIVQLHLNMFYDDLAHFYEIMPMKTRPKKYSWDWIAELEEFLDRDRHRLTEVLGCYMEFPYEVYIGGWLEVFREPSIMRHLLAFFNKQGLVAQNMTDEQAVEALVAFHSSEFHRDPSPESITLRVRKQLHQQFAEQAFALFRDRFPQQLAEVKSSADYNDDASVVVSFHERPHMLQAIIVRILESRSARRAAALLRGREAETFLDIIQLVLETAQDATPRTKENTRPLCKNMTELSVQVSASSEVLPSALFINGVKYENIAEPEARGGFSSVYRGFYRGREVAIKRFHPFVKISAAWMLRQEALIWRTLTHPNVLQFVGLHSEEFDRSSLISPWLENGTLRHFLADSRSHGVDVTQLIWQVCRGLAYLHSQGIVHGDLRGNNILVDKDFCPKVADLGLANFITASNSAPQAKFIGTFRWCAPEVLLDDGVRSKESDVYAFGWTIIEIFTLERPHHEADDFRAIIMVCQGEPPARPGAEQCHGRLLSDELWKLVRSCLSTQVSERPVADEVMTRLESLLPSLATSM